ncbi:MAG: hypothetical protein ABR875_01200 [Minisyncoccia bacterium]|jgi:dolichol kinase
MNTILTSLVFLASFVLVEAIQRKTKLENEYSRKIVHITSAIIVFLMPYYLNRLDIIGLSLFFIIFLLVTKKLGFLQSIHRVGRHSLGEIYFPLGVGLTAFFFLPNNIISFQFGFLILGFSDAIGGLVGYSLGNRKTILLGNKSIEGTATFFLTTFLIFIFFIYSKTSTNLISAFPVVLLITLTELIFTGGLDNLFLPILSAVLIKVLLS